MSALLLNYGASGSGGGVTSISGDGTVINNSSSTGAVTLNLANAPASTVLGNNTASSAAPAYIYGDVGINISTATSGTINLTANSASTQVLMATLSGVVTFTLPAASTCPNKVFRFIRNVPGGSFGWVISVFSGDTIYNLSTTVTGFTMQTSNGNGQEKFTIVSDGGTHWFIQQDPIQNLASGGTGTSFGALSPGSVITSSSTSSLTQTGVGISGQKLISKATATPAWQSNVIKTANYTAVAGDEIQADTASVGAFTVTLPAAPAFGDEVKINDATNNWTIANLTIARNGLNINGGASNYTGNVSGSKLSAVYISVAYGWSIK